MWDIAKSRFPGLIPNFLNHTLAYNPGICIFTSSEVIVMHPKFSDSVPQNKNDQEKKIWLKMARDKNRYMNRFMKTCLALCKNEKQGNTLSWKYILEHALNNGFNLTRIGFKPRGTKLHRNKKQHGLCLWWARAVGSQHTDLTLDVKQCFPSPRAFSYPTVFGSRTVKDNLLMHYHLHF